MALQRLRDTRVIAPECAMEDAASQVGVASSTPTSPEYVVCQRSVAEGEMVRVMPFGDSATLFKLVIDRQLKLLATVPERHRADVKLGQDVELAVEAYPGEKFMGKVVRINPSIDRANRTFQVEIHVPNEDRRLSPGSFAKASILTRVDSAAPTVPEEAIVSFAGVTKVFVVHDAKAHEIPVRRGVTIDAAGTDRSRTWVEVEGDLPAGTPVITSGHSQIAEGTAVRIRSAETVVRNK
jgi:RND family efflux transporter MFP subunit